MTKQVDEGLSGKNNVEIKTNEFKNNNTNRYAHG